MKTLNIHLEDAEYKQLKKVKRKRTWKELLMSVVDNDKREGDYN